jgi:hypothetical protein
MPEVDIEDVIRAMLASQQMDETQAYLTRGRIHEPMADDLLTSAWVIAFKAFAQSQKQSDLVRVNDLDAEIRLRGIDRPVEEIQTGADTGIQDLREDAPFTENVREAIETFLRQMSERKN